jgi:hypothetical protein
MSSLVTHMSDYPQIVGGTTSWELSEELSQGEVYYWHVRAGDGFEYSPWSPPASFLMPYDYVCGDASGDGQVDVGDAVWLINHIFKYGPAPEPADAGDANADGEVNIGDAVYMIVYIFRDGPPPQCP